MNKFIAYTVGVIFGLFVLTSCIYQDMMDKFVPKEEARMAENYLTKLREKDFEFIKSKLSNELKPQVTDELLIQLSDFFRDGELISTEIIGAQVNVFNGVWHGNFTFEYHFTEGWNLANAAFRRVGDTYEVIGLNVYQTAMSQNKIHAFSLSGKSLLHYLVFVLAVFAPIFIVVSTYFCIRTPITKRKWLWLIFILLGVSAIQINWTTGQYAIQLISIHLLGASAFTAGPHAPWVISASIPVGAILFWIKRKRFFQLSKEANTSHKLDGAPQG